MRMGPKTRCQLCCRVFCWALVVLLSALPGGCSSEEAGAQSAARGPGQGGQMPPPGVRVARAEQRPLTLYVDFTGEVLADRMVQVAPLESGRLVTLRVDEGDRVEAGQLIGELDNDLQRRRRSEAEARLETAEARVAQARAELEQRTREVERRRPLVERNVFPEAEFDQLRDQLEVLEQSVALAESQVGEARAAMSSSRADLDRREIHAPIGGLVAERHVSVGAMVGPQAPLVTVVDEDSLRLVVRLSEQRLDTVGVGTRAEVRFDAMPTRPFEAAVSRIGSIVDRASRTVEVELRVEAEAGVLRHGMFARGRFVGERVEDAVVVPAEAVQRAPDESTTVWTVVEGAAQPVTVTIELETEQELAVSGLAAESTVILSPPMGLEAGSPVYVVGGSGEAPTPPPNGPRRGRP